MDGQPVQEAPIALRSGRELFLNDTASVFSLAAKRNAKSVAKLGVKDGKVPLTVLKQDRFPKLKEAPPDTLGKTIPLKAESGQSVTLKVQLTDAVRSADKAPPVEKPRDPEKASAAAAAKRRKTTAKKKTPPKKVPSKERKK